VDEEVNRDENGEADEMNLEVDSKRQSDAYLNERSVTFKEEMVARCEPSRSIPSGTALRSGTSTVNRLQNFWRRLRFRSVVPYRRLLQ